MALGAVVALPFLSGCTASTPRLVCPPLVNWPVALQNQAATELTTHPDLTATVELIRLGSVQRDAVRACEGQ